MNLEEYLRLNNNSVNKFIIKRDNSRPQSRVGTRTSCGIARTKLNRKDLSPLTKN
jgi:hypothetical protein